LEQGLEREVRDPDRLAIPHDVGVLVRIVELLRQQVVPPVADDRVGIRIVRVGLGSAPAWGVVAAVRVADLVDGRLPGDAAGLPPPVPEAPPAGRPRKSVAGARDVAEAGPAPTAAILNRARRRREGAIIIHVERRVVLLADLAQIAQERIPAGAVVGDLLVVW